MNILQKVGASILGLKAYYAPGITMMLGGSFSWSYKAKQGQLVSGYQNKIVYATVNVLVRKLIEAPIIVSKIKSQKDLARVKTYNFAAGNEHGKYNLKLQKALEEIEEHDLIDLLNKPNEYQTGIELREAFWYNYELTGDGYFFVEKNGDKPVFIHCLPSDRVIPRREGDDWRKPITGYKFSAWDGSQIELPMDDVMHMRRWSPLDPLQGGYSPLQSVGSSVSKNDANDIAQGNAFTNGGTGTIISSDIVVENGKTYSKLSTDQVKKINETVQRNWAGIENNGKFHVTNGSIKVDKLGDTLIDLNAINADNQDATRIAAGWGVSPILIGDMSGGTDNNVKGAYKALVTNVVVPELRKFDAKFKEFSRKWYKGERLDASHDLTEFSELAPDLELMKKVYGDAWYITGNEKRKIFNMDESADPNLNRFIIPSGQMFLDDMATDDFGDGTGNPDQL